MIQQEDPPSDLVMTDRPKAVAVDLKFLLQLGNISWCLSQLKRVPDIPMVWGRT